jgi:hypothetical protein
LRVIRMVMPMTLYRVRSPGGHMENAIAVAGKVGVPRLCSR